MAWRAVKQMPTLPLSFRPHLKSKQSPHTPIAPLSSDANVLELPWVGGIKFFGKELAASDQRGPIGIGAHDRAEIGQANIKHTTKIDFVGLNHALRGTLDSPHHAGQDGNADLKAGGIVVRAKLPRLFDRELRAVPISALCMTGEQDAELINTRDYLLHH